MSLTCTDTIGNYKREEMGPFFAKFILELLTFCFCNYFSGGEKIEVEIQLLVHSNHRLTHCLRLFFLFTGSTNVEKPGEVT